MLYQDANLKIDVSLDRIKKNVKKAQFYLDNQVMNSMTPYRYLYEGKKMVDTKTGKGPYPLKDGNGNVIGFRYRKGAKLQPTTQPLIYTRPSATPRWFDTAKAQHKSQWVSGVKKIIGGK